MTEYTKTEPARQLLADYGYQGNADQPSALPPIVPAIVPVLVVDDGSEYSERAWPWCAWQSGQAGVAALYSACAIHATTRPIIVRNAITVPKSDHDTYYLPSSQDIRTGNQAVSTPPAHAGCKRGASAWSAQLLKGTTAAAYLGGLQLTENANYADGFMSTTVVPGMSAPQRGVLLLPGEYLWVLSNVAQTTINVGWEWQECCYRLTAPKHQEA